MTTLTNPSKEEQARLPRPFLKWPGGKTSLLPELMKRVDMAGDFGRYHEPFLGGGALFFHLFREKRLQRQAYLSDVNPRLIETYSALSQDFGAVAFPLDAHARAHGEDYYYEVRARKISSIYGRAARLIYLNKTCFNGLHRENSKGEFNAPIGDYDNPNICDAENLEAASKALKKRSKLYTGHFSDVLDRAKEGDLVYLDPPYVPISETANFTGYHAGGFASGQHLILGYTFRLLSDMGVKVLLSNSDTEFVRALYDEFTIDEVKGRRSISRNGNGRGKANDLLIRNFSPAWTDEDLAGVRVVKEPEGANHETQS